MFRYIATKGRESVLCTFDNMLDMSASMVRHIGFGFKIKSVD